MLPEYCAIMGATRCQTKPRGSHTGDWRLAAKQIIVTVPRLNDDQSRRG